MKDDKSTKKLTSEEIANLRLFSEKAKLLQSEADVFKELSIKIKFGEFPTETKKEVPDERLFKSFLMGFRPFVLNDESINFYRISSLIMSYGNTKQKNKTKKARIAWGKLRDEKKENTPTGGMAFNMGDKEISQGELFDLWLNAKHFHPTEKNSKVEYLKKISVNPFFDMLDIVFIDTIYKMSYVLFWYNINVIEEFLKNYQEQ